MDEIYVHQLSTGARLHRVAPDFVGAATVGCRRAHGWFFASLTGFTTPGVVARYDFASAPIEESGKRWSVYRTTRVAGLDPEDFRAEQVWFGSRDGTRVPMFVVRHKDTKFDGTAPALQYGASCPLFPCPPSFRCPRVGIGTLLTGWG